MQTCCGRVPRHREGTLRLLGVPQTDGYLAYVTLLNARDGGINGVPVIGEGCETAYDVPRGVGPNLAKDDCSAK